MKLTRDRLVRGLRTMAAVVVLFAASQPASAAVALKKGDHICLIGNTLADRMQHDGYTEAYLQAAFPGHSLVIRNLGFSGDRIDHRPRAHKAYGDEHHHLTISKADVIFAFFGYNESYDNKPDDFKNKVVKFLDDAAGRQYNGKSAPRVVLFSPIAHENLNHPSLPTGKANNARLAAYTKAMAAAAKEKNVPFVDLFTASQKLYASSKAPLTINGVHLNAEGHKLIGATIAKAISGKSAATGTAVEKIRAAVLSKNWCWHNRYRATDGNDVWGGRSKLHGNKANLMHELKMLDVMTANRDKKVWAAANGKTLTVNDSNVPKALVVKTNLKKDGKTGSTSYMPAKETAAKMKMAKGMKINVFASEEMFPQLVNPVQTAIDTKGRLWVAAWESYPKWEPLKKLKDKILIFPDDNRDGVADKCIEFATVHNPTGLELWGGGVIVCSAPDIIFLKDTDGDDKADFRQVIFSGIDSADTHHTANAFIYGPGGYLYYQRGVFHKSNVETPWGKSQESGASGMYRFNPRTHAFSFHAKNSPNPHGISFDYWGYHYATDGTGGRAYQVRPNGKGGFNMRTLLKKRVRPVPASGILSSAHFPPENNGNFLICNAIGFLGIKQYKLSWNNGDANGTEIEDIMVSGDRNFRPTDFEIGDDGSLLVADWSNAIVGHMQHNIRDPSRDHKHGRIFRITYEGRPLSKHVDIDGQPIPKLLDALKHPINIIRRRARIELSERDTKEVIAATQKWVKQFDPTKAEDAHHILEALWVHQQHDVVNRPLLDAVLKSPVDHARIAAATVKQFWDTRPTEK